MILIQVKLTQYDCVRRADQEKDENAEGEGEGENGEEGEKEGTDKGVLSQKTFESC